jgi:kynurenine 3-monooxygenase
MTDDVGIVGAGLAGCLLACFLARRGHRVTLYERRPDPRVTGPWVGRRGDGKAPRGRSINLALSERGLDALRRVGLDGAVMKTALPMYGRMMHAPSGELSFQPYSADRQRAINSISRGDLNATLLDACTELPGVQVHFGQRITGVEELAGRHPVVIGADGAHSAVRQAVPAFEDREEYLDYGYRELSIPPAGGQFALDPQALHIWPRGRAMMIALPNPDRSFTCTVFWPHEGPGSFAELATPEAVEAHFREHYPDAYALMPDLAADYARNPLGELLTVHCWPWVHDGRVALLGDAAHAILPFYGQGANCAFEDCVELDRCLAETGDAWPEALELYQERRKENTDTIAEMARDNFVEMRDKVGSPAFLLRKRVEHALERALPGRYVSQYELVSFSTVPYAQVRRRTKHRLLGVLLGRNRVRADQFSRVGQG